MTQTHPDSLADIVAHAATMVIALGEGRGQRTGLLWRDDVIVASDQSVSNRSPISATLPDGQTVGASIAGRDPTTNIVLLRLPTPLAGVAGFAAATAASGLRVGAFTVLVGADGSGGPTARLGLVHQIGPAWQSMAGGRIDALIRLDARLSSRDEGGLVLDASGAFVGMSTLGPRRRTIVIPTATIARVIDPLLRSGRLPRGWLGVALQPVAIPTGLRSTSGREAGLMVVELTSGAPLERAGFLPGDIILTIDDQPIADPRALAAHLGPDAVGRTVVLGLLRAGGLITLSATIDPRPETCA